VLVLAVMGKRTSDGVWRLHGVVGESVKNQ